MWHKLVILITAAILSFSLFAGPVETYTFKDEVTEKRYQSLVKELRCPKCQNQNLADSNSQIAVDLRLQVYEMLQQGKADIEIVNFMVERYGEFVLYKPRVSSLTYILWFGPAILMIGGVIVVILLIRRKPQRADQKIMTETERNQLDKILKDK